MVDNRLYNGRILHNGEEASRWTDDPPIPDDLWERTQRRLAHFAKTRAREAGSWPFRGIAKCGICGGRMRHDARTYKTGKRYVYLRCDEKGCNEVRLDSEPFELSFCLHLIGISDALLHLIETDPDYGVTKTEERSLAEVEGILAEVEARLSRLNDVYIDGGIKDDDPRFIAARDQRDAATAERDRIAGRRNDAREELHDLAEIIRAFWKKAPDTAIGLTWLDGDDEEKRELLRRTLSKLTLYPDRLTFHFQLNLPESVWLIDRPYLFPRGDRFTRQENLDHAAAAAQSP